MFPLDDLLLTDAGFGRRLPCGQGVAVLFPAPPGDREDIAAEAVADTLEQDLDRIELSAVVFLKYVGETEKNPAAALDVAERSGAILSLEEAGAHFGKRTEIRDAHDRYTNLKVNYLLQRMESFTELVILASNPEAARVLAGAPPLSVDKKVRTPFTRWPAATNAKCRSENA